MATQVAYSTAEIAARLSPEHTAANHESVQKKLDRRDAGGENVADAARVYDLEAKVANLERRMADLEGRIANLERAPARFG